MTDMEVLDDMFTDAPEHRRPRSLWWLLVWALAGAALGVLAAAVLMFAGVWL